MPAPSRRKLGVEGERAGDLEDARRVFGALDVSPEPEALVGDPRDHFATTSWSLLAPASVAASCRTQVSSDPPPWLEFTTYEPSRSATRVSPPGSTHDPSGDVRTNGRRSTRRGTSLRPGESHVGQVDSSILCC